MLLAAGEGRRLQPLTEHMPKPMLAIAGRPILEHNVRLLAHHGIREIVVNLHHCPEAVTSYFGDGRNWGVSLHYSYEEHLLGTAGAVMRVRELFSQGAFFVVYGDNLTNCDLTALQAQHERTAAVATVALFERDDVSASGVAVLDEADRISAFIEKPEGPSVPSHWVNAGLILLEPDALGAVPDRVPVDFGFDVLPALIRRGDAVSGYRMREDLWWVDTPAAYEEIRALGEKGVLNLV